ncbi:MAG: hypothetical protein N4A38_05005 [Candidatus Gracilibacteria bacterium]|nr:hypothetical protein [Candidatus Gracilibacteria bacterium]
MFSFNKKFISRSNKGYVFIESKLYHLSELGNFLVGFNGAATRHTLNEIKQMGLDVEIIIKGRSILEAKINEKEDQIFYEAGFKCFNEILENGEVSGYIIYKSMIKQLLWSRKNLQKDNYVYNVIGE